MENIDDTSNTLECKNVSADVAARYAFLQAVSDLPHSGISTSPAYDLAHTIEAEIIPRLETFSRTALMEGVARPGLSRWRESRPLT